MIHGWMKRGDSRRLACSVGRARRSRLLRPEALPGWFRAPPRRASLALGRANHLSRFGSTTHGQGGRGTGRNAIGPPTDSASTTSDVIRPRSVSGSGTESPRVDRIRTRGGSVNPAADSPPLTTEFRAHIEGGCVPDVQGCLPVRTESVRSRLVYFCSQLGSNRRATISDLW